MCPHGMVTIYLTIGQRSLVRWCIHGHSEKIFYVIKYNNYIPNGWVGYSHAWQASVQQSNKDYPLDDGHVEIFINMKLIICKNILIIIL